MAASSNILIVDDDPDIRQVLKILLSETYTVAEASSGMEAVAYVKEHPELDLVLLDVMMPGMDGFQTCDAIRKDSNVPVLFLTAKSAENDRVSGGDDFLSKPFSSVELLPRSARCCAGIRSTAASRKRRLQWRILRSISRRTRSRAAASPSP